jgi:hypothetical protein
MANVNVPQDKRKSKLQRRRKDVDRQIEKMRAEAVAKGHPADCDVVERKIRDLRKAMRYER